MENILNNIHALIATILALVGAIGYVINKKRKVKELLKTLGITRKDVSEETYKYITSKEYTKHLNYAFDEEELEVKDYE